jgi:hypothetical protein
MLQVHDSSTDMLPPGATHRCAGVEAAACCLALISKGPVVAQLWSHYGQLLRFVRFILVSPRASVTVALQQLCLLLTAAGPLSCCMFMSCPNGVNQCMLNRTLNSTPYLTLPI